MQPLSDKQRNRGGELEDGLSRLKRVKIKPVQTKIWCKENKGKIK